jgi:hypothetical protein
MRSHAQSESPALPSILSASFYTLFGRPGRTASAEDFIERELHIDFNRKPP